MCPTHKAQPFHVTTHQLALQNIVPSFSFKVSHNNIFMHMFKHSKKWVQIIINWLNSLTSKVMGKFGPFISRYSPLPHPGGGPDFHEVPLAFSPGDPFLPWLRRASQNCRSCWRAQGALCQAPHSSNSHLQILANSFPSQVPASEHGGWISVPYNTYTWCSRVWCLERSLLFAGALTLNPQCSQEDIPFPGCSPL